MEGDNPAMASLYRATYGILFFGTPHRGLLVEDIRQRVEGQGANPRSALLDEVMKNSELLEYQLVDFKNLIRDRKIVSFYETGQTRQLLWVSNSCGLSL